MVRRRATRLTGLRWGILALALFAGAKDPPKVELALKDMDGRPVRLSGLRGKIVVLTFWATWCVPCNAEMPMLVEAEKAYSGRDAVFVAASLDEGKTRKQVPDFVRKYQVTFPVWLGASADDLADLGMGPAVPATAFVDRDGSVVARVWGQMREEELNERLGWLAGPRTGPAPEPLVKHLSK